MRSCSLLGVEPYPLQYVIPRVRERRKRDVEVPSGWCPAGKAVGAGPMEWDGDLNGFTKIEHLPSFLPLLQDIKTLGLRYYGS
jgi:hypothetical protein